jgi:phosphatidylglycerophosphatase C
MDGFESSSGGDRPLAVFDLDGTLIRGDCMLPFLCGYSRRYRPTALPGIAWDVALYAAGIQSAQAAKERVVRRALAGEHRERIDSFTREFCRTWVDRRLHPIGMPLLRRHQELGHRVIVMSASPSVYVPLIAEHFGVRETISTAIRFEREICRGSIDGLNCKGPEKVERLRSYLAGSPCGPIYAYGDSDSDGPVLSWAEHGFLVTRTAARRWKGAGGADRTPSPAAQ